jgi:ketosteroid isomerase-like protein
MGRDLSRSDGRAGRVLVNDHRVLVWAHWSGHAARSQAPVDMMMAQVLTLEGGKVRRCEEYFDRAEALESVVLGGSNIA